LKIFHPTSLDERGNCPRMERQITDIPRIICVQQWHFCTKSGQAFLKNWQFADLAMLQPHLNFEWLEKIPMNLERLGDVADSRFITRAGTPFAKGD